MWRQRRCQAQTREHAFLARVLGVSQLIVNVNKMDISGVDWSQDKYNETVTEVSALLKGAGYKPDEITFVPCSAFHGDNVFNKSENTSWYSGPTLFEAIDAIEMPPKPTDRPLRLPIQDVYKISGIGTVPVGKIETGVLNTGKTVIFNPSQKSAEVKSMRCTTQWSTRPSQATTSVQRTWTHDKTTSAEETSLDTERASLFRPT